MTRIRSLIRDTLIWFVWFVLRPFARMIPLSISYRIAAAGSAALFFVDKKRAKIIIAELRKIFREKTEREIRDIAIQSYVMYYKRQAENLVFGKLTKDRLEKMVEIEGMDNITTALEQGKGAIILVSHFGSHLLPILTLAYRGYRISQVAGGAKVVKQLSPIYERVVKIRLKESRDMPITFLSADQSMMAAFKSLKRNELVAIALDGRTGKKWIRVNMFGLETTLSPGPARIAMATGAPIIPAFIVRQRDDTHRLFFEPPVALEHSGSEEEMLLRTTQKLADIFAAYVTNYPCHFGMILQIMRERAKKGIIESSLLPEQG